VQDDQRWRLLSPPVIGWVLYDLRLVPPERRGEDFDR
jgi:hypothetical protein